MTKKTKGILFVTPFILLILILFGLLFYQNPLMVLSFLFVGSVMLLAVYGMNLLIEESEQNGKSN